MAAKAGGHYGTVLQSHRRVTQGNPLSSTIFDVVVDDVIRHWVTVVVPSQEGTRQVLRASIQTQSMLFYANDGLVVSL